MGDFHDISLWLSPSICKIFCRNHDFTIGWTVGEPATLASFMVGTVDNGIISIIDIHTYHGNDPSELDLEEYYGHTNTSPSGYIIITITINIFNPFDMFCAQRFLPKQS